MLWILMVAQWKIIVSLPQTQYQITGTLVPDSPPDILQPLAKQLDRFFSEFVLIKFIFCFKTIQFPF